MSERSLTIWHLLVGMTIVSVLATGFKLFPMNKKYNRMKARSSNLQFGTDKELENIIAYLETRLEDRSEFQFEIENLPMMLTNVLGLADGSGRRVRRNKNAIRVAMVYQREDHFQAQIDYRGQVFTVAAGDTIPNIGIIEMIDQTQVLIQTDNGVKSYPTPRNEITSFNGDNHNITVSSLKIKRIMKNKVRDIVANETMFLKPGFGSIKK